MAEESFYILNQEMKHCLCYDHIDISRVTFTEILFSQHQQQILNGHIWATLFLLPEDGGYIIQ